MNMLDTHNNVTLHNIQTLLNCLPLHVCLFARYNWYSGPGRSRKAIHEDKVIASEYSSYRLMPWLLDSMTFLFFLSVTFYLYLCAITVHHVILLICHFVGGENFTVEDM